jgi:hypothetical protein
MLAAQQTHFCKLIAAFKTSRPACPAARSRWLHVIVAVAVVEMLGGALIVLSRCNHDHD